MIHRQSAHPPIDARTQRVNIFGIKGSRTARPNGLPITSRGRSSRHHCSLANVDSFSPIIQRFIWISTWNRLVPRYLTLFDTLCGRGVKATSNQQLKSKENKNPYTMLTQVIRAVDEGCINMKTMCSFRHRDSAKTNYKLFLPSFFSNQNIFVIFLPPSARKV